MKKTLIWRDSFKERCMINRSNNKVKINNKENKYPINKWDKSIMKRENRTLRTNKERPKERGTLISIYRANNRASNN